MKTRKFMSIAVLTLVCIAPLAMASTTTKWYVDGVNGSDNNNCKSPTTACKTIGHAISLASSGGSINVAAATYKENLTIAVGLRIVGASAVTTVIDGGGLGTTITITGEASVGLSQLTVTHGSAINNGGGIFNSGRLTISRSTISGNSAGTSLGVCVGNGGGVYNSGILTINSSTISGNLATVYRGCINPTTAYGGGLYNNGTSIINNSTVSDNSVFANCINVECASLGGGIANFGQTLKISNSTISGNSAQTDAGGIYNGATLQNTIVANSTSGGNCLGVTSNGYNLSSDGTCNFTGPGDLNNTDPKLGPLQNNGGPTQTQALLSGSPAIDAGNPNGCTDDSGRLLKTDQRGAPRPDKEDSSGCDMGAYERQRD
jgi:hypothetical protein